MDDLNIVLDPDAALSLQRQLRRWFVDAIHRGVLQPGRRLPSSRVLARRVRVSRNTVSLAYDALLAEGHLVSRARSGIFVSGDVPSGRIATGQRVSAPRSPLANRLATPVDVAGFRIPGNWHQYPFPFLDGRVDADLMPSAEWREAMKLACSRQEVAAWNQGAGDIDDPMLLDELRGKVLPARGMDVDADEILVTPSGRSALQLVGELFVRRGTPLVLEPPVDPEFERRMKERQADITWLDPDLARALPPGAVVVTSARRSFPAGSPRLRRLLAAVSAADGVLVEHDMPPGARDGSQASPALRAMDEAGRVVFVASLAPVVSCGEPLGMVVTLPALIERLRQLRRAQGTVPAPVLQRAWAYFIGLGHYWAALQRTGKVLDARRMALRDALNHYLHKFVDIETLPGASAYWVRLRAEGDARDLARRAAAVGVLIEPVRLDGDREALCMGISGIGEARIRAGVVALSRLIRGDLAPAPRQLGDDGVPPLRGRALKQAMAGATLLYNTVYGDPCTLEVRPDGQLVGTAGYAAEDCDTGRWWISGDRWHRQWQRWAYGEATGFSVVVDGDQLRWYGADGLLADTAVITRRGAARAARGNGPGQKLAP